METLIFLASSLVASMDLDTIRVNREKIERFSWRQNGSSCECPVFHIQQVNYKRRMRKFGHSQEQATPSSSGDLHETSSNLDANMRDARGYYGSNCHTSLHRILRLWSCPSTLDKDDKGCDEVEWEDFSEGQRVSCRCCDANTLFCLFPGAPKADSMVSALSNG